MGKRAVELVLGQRLQAIGVADIKSYLSAVEGLKQGNVTLLEYLPCDFPSSSNTLLLNKIHSKWPIQNLINDVYIAESISEAYEQLQKFADHESIITKDGIWLGKGWLHIHQDKEVTTGLITREKELQHIIETIAQTKQTVTEFENTLKESKMRLENLEELKERIQHQINDGKAQAAQMTAQVQIKQAKLQQLHQRSQALTHEVNELLTQQEHVQFDLQTARKQWQTALEATRRYQQRQAELKSHREEAISNYRTLHLQIQSSKEHVQLLSSQLQTLTVQLDTKRQHRRRVQNQFIEQQQRCEHLRQQLAEAENPLAGLRQELQICCEKQLTIEQQLNEFRSKLQDVEHELRTLDKNKVTVELQLQTVRTKLEDLRINKQSIIVRRDTLIEQLTETHFLLTDIQRLITDNDSINYLEDELHQLNQRISRLGAINLAAIDEYKIESERKQFLDAQYHDLISALTTLQEAIRKIDQETRSRFHETFTQINQGLQELFPKLFGGGQAYLELTEDNLLEAGVNIMARPPGKRNSTIHLLSGGEKALTAVALVFAIFQLNPAPFCLLDEVDAPLDDANVIRFCNLLRAMSDKVQFLYITHNKLSMETAEQLIGITMREPGVSRLVAVDIEEALKMVET